MSSLVISPFHIEQAPPLNGLSLIENDEIDLCISAVP